MSAPLWFLLAICSLETGMLVAMLARKQWMDVIYWGGVLLINASLVSRSR